MVFVGRLLRTTGNNKRSMFREVFPNQSNVWVRGTLPHRIEPYKANALTYAVFGSIILYFAYNIPVIKYFTRAPEPVKTDVVKYDRHTKSYVN